jgi:hypothetical protein
MNKTIEKLNKKLQSISADVSEVESQLQKEWNKVFKEMPELNNAIEALQVSKDFIWNKYDEIAQWIRFDLSDFQDIKKYFTEYMQENHLVTVEWDSDALSYSQGPSIVINEDGDVLDQEGNKWFISKNDYRDDDGELNEAKRNELIEQYMEKSGYFPGVFRSDRYGNIFNVNTKGE